MANHITLFVIFLSFAGNAAELEIGGVRQVRANVTHETAKIVCKVSFISVSCFDAGMNRIVNQQKARAYAVQAMSRAHGLADGMVSASNLHSVTMPIIEANRLTVTYQADDIKLLQERKSTSDHSARNDTDSKPVTTDTTWGTNLLACLDDTRATLQTITIAFQEQVARLKADDALDDAIAALENSGVDAFETLAKEVKNQKLLLQIEKDELLPQIKRSRDEFLKNLAKAYTVLQHSGNP